MCGACLDLGRTCDNCSGNRKSRIFLTITNVPSEAHTMNETLEGQQLVAVARAIATLAHTGQVDKASHPYIDHPRRVAWRLVEENPDYRYGDIAVAWLHDVLEDTGITIADLKACGIPGDVIADVVLLTRDPKQPVEDYYAGIRTRSQRARRVKLADIADNMHPMRLAQLDDATVVRLVKKYAKALDLLGEKP